MTQETTVGKISGEGRAHDVISIRPLYNWVIWTFDLVYGSSLSVASIQARAHIKLPGVSVQNASEAAFGGEGVGHRDSIARVLIAAPNPQGTGVEGHVHGDVPELSCKRRNERFLFRELRG